MEANATRSFAAQPQTKAEKEWKNITLQRVHVFKVSPSASRTLTPALVLTLI